MKKIFVLALLMSALTATSQSFEGTISWAVTGRLNDPKKQAELERMQKMAADPANQQRLKQMQDQMNSPEMKAMLDANPQMKQRMEMMMKAMQGGGGGGVIPKAFIMKYKNQNASTSMQGGIINLEMLYIASKKQAYQIDRSAKTYSPLNTTDSSRKSNMKRTVTKTNESRKILGYTCTKYLVTLVGARDTIYQTFWTTTELKGIDWRSMANQTMGGGGQSFYAEGVNGIPLRMEMKTPQISMEMEANSIKKESLPDSDFVIPADFKETKGMM